MTKRMTENTIFVFMSMKWANEEKKDKNQQTKTRTYFLFNNDRMIVSDQMSPEP
jgi:hypothetical protein